MTVNTVIQKSVTPEEKHHKTLLEGYYEAWVTIERAGCPKPILCCFIASLRLALNTLHEVEDELTVLMELAQAKLKQIEAEDAGIAAFDQYLYGGRT